MLGISVSKFHELVPVVENKDPYRLHACLEQTPSEPDPQNSTRCTLLWGRADFFNDDLGRLTGTEALVAFFITRDNSPDNGITILCWGVNS